MKNLILIFMALLGITMTAQEYKHYHYGNGFESEATNPWVTNGGTCRTAVTVNGVTSDCTLNVMIDNDSTKIKENEVSTIKSMMQKYHNEVTAGGQTMWQWHVAVPISFDVVGDESIVDHYELCGYNHENNNTYPIGGKNVPKGADDNSWAAGGILQTATNSPTNTMSIAVNDTHHYDCFKVEYIDPNTHLPVYSHVPVFDIPDLTPVDKKPSGDITISCYIKVYYKEELGLAPTYHSLNNIKYSEQKIVTDVEDVEIEKQDAAMYNLQGMRIYEAKGLYIQNGKLHRK